MLTLIKSHRESNFKQTNSGKSKRENIRKHIQTSCGLCLFIIECAFIVKKESHTRIILIH